MHLHSDNPTHLDKTGIRWIDMPDSASVLTMTGGRVAD